MERSKEENGFQRVFNVFVVFPIIAVVFSYGIYCLVTNDSFRSALRAPCEVVFSSIGNDEKVAIASEGVEAFLTLSVSQKVECVMLISLVMHLVCQLLFCILALGLLAVECILALATISLKNAWVKSQEKYLGDV